MALDFQKILTDANAYAQTYDARIILSLDGGDGVGTFVMIDEDGEETCRLDVTDGGVYNNRQLMAITDDEGEYLMEAFGQLLVKVMWC